MKAADGRGVVAERWDLAPDLSISRVLTGLWQIADMERDGRPTGRNFLVPPIQ